jgi:hypothetical protein
MVFIDDISFRIQKISFQDYYKVQHDCEIIDLQCCPLHQYTPHTIRATPNQVLNGEETKKIIFCFSLPVFHVPI